MNQEISIIDLILHASWIVQLVMIILLFMSLSSWATIFSKASKLKLIKNLDKDFENNFWSGHTLSDLYLSSINKKNIGSMQKIFTIGMKEFNKLTEQKITDKDILLTSSRRAMQVAFQRELDNLENGLSHLATIASSAPYIGLFGTVWGVMHAFTGFSDMEQITLATVAPGIAEALVATAMGLFAAIPAVIFYNSYINKINRLANNQETFIEEFSNILQRNS